MSFETSSQIQSFDWQKLLLSFDGRTRRSHFWIGWLICLGVGVIAGWLPLIGALISLALIWPNIALTVKRLHDMGKSGWFAAIPWAANLVGGGFAFATLGITAITNSAALEREEPWAVFALLGPVLGVLCLLALVNLGFLLWVGVTDSQPGDNRFGPNLKGL